MCDVTWQMPIGHFFGVDVVTPLKIWIVTKVTIDQVFVIWHSLEKWVKNIWQMKLQHSRNDFCLKWQYKNDISNMMWHRTQLLMQKLNVTAGWDETVILRIHFVTKDENTGSINIKDKEVNIPFNNQDFMERT